jgi:hypothetical protein
MMPQWVYWLCDLTMLAALCSVFLSNRKMRAVYKEADAVLERAIITNRKAMANAAIINGVLEKIRKGQSTEEILAIIASEIAIQEVMYGDPPE